MANGITDPDVARFGVVSQALGAGPTAGTEGLGLAQPGGGGFGNLLQGFGQALALGGAGLRGDVLPLIVSMQQRQQQQAARLQAQRQQAQLELEQFRTVFDVMKGLDISSMSGDGQAALQKMLDRFGYGGLLSSFKEDAQGTRDAIGFYLWQATGATGTEAPPLAGGAQGPTSTPQQLETGQTIGALRQLPVKEQKAFLEQLRKAHAERLQQEARESTPAGLERLEALRRENFERGITSGARVTSELAKGARESIAASREAQTLESEVASARNQAKASGRPATLQTQIGDDAVTLQETVPGSGKWEMLAIGGKDVRGPKKPLVEIFQGMTPEQAGRFSQFRAGLRDIEQLIPTVFEGGDLEKGKVNRTNLFTAWLNLPFTKGRDINRFMSDAIEAKLRAETGAAAPQQEVDRILARFKPSLQDTDNQIRSKVRNLYDYLRDTVVLTDPQGRMPGNRPAAPTKPFMQRRAEIQKEHPEWTEFEVFGRLNAEGYP